MGRWLEWFGLRRRVGRVRIRGRRLKTRRFSRATVEWLEERALLVAVAGDVAGIVDVPVSNDMSHLSYPQYLVASQSQGPVGYTPAVVRHAYGFDQIFYGAVAGDGRNQTIAIIDAYNDPNIASDLITFDLTLGLPDPPSFAKYWQIVGGQPPADDSGWALEISLDVEWSHAMAPAANILLVEAFDNSDANLFAAAQWASQQAGVSAVSMSFGGSEYSGQTAYDSIFQTPAGHQGVTFIASSGDRSSGGYYSLYDPNPMYPSSSPNVVGLGGTSLYVDAAGNYLSESAWSGSGGGISTVESKPSYQSGVTQSSAWRVSPDVAFVADPNTGVAVYDSYATDGAPWIQVGGTSVSAPIFAGMMAVADEGRALKGLNTLDGPTQTLPALYSMPSFIRDITTGGPPVYPATAGYDPSTGLGTPYVPLLVPGLVASNTPEHTANMNFVAAAYLDILGRPVDSSSQLYFALLLDNGTPRSTIVNSIDHSTEYYANIIVKPAYLNYLGRPADAAGLAFWVDQLQFHGLSDEQFEANLVASDEFYVRAGGTNVLWVDAMYVDLLGRPADPAGEAFWVQQLALGVSRYSVAYGFAASLEREQQRITYDYVHYLGREPDQQGLNYWLTQFALGVTNEDLITGIVSSDEYYAKNTV